MNQYLNDAFFIETFILFLINFIFIYFSSFLSPLFHHLSQISSRDHHLPLPYHLPLKNLLNSHHHAIHLLLQYLIIMAIHSLKLHLTNLLVKNLITHFLLNQYFSIFIFRTLIFQDLKLRLTSMIQYSKIANFFTQKMMQSFQFMIDSNRKVYFMMMSKYH